MTDVSFFKVTEEQNSVMCNLEVLAMHLLCVAYCFTLKMDSVAFSVAILQTGDQILNKIRIYSLRLTSILSVPPCKFFSCRYHHVKLMSRSYGRRVAVVGRTWPPRPDVEPL